MNKLCWVFVLFFTSELFGGVYYPAIYLPHANPVVTYEGSISDSNVMVPIPPKDRIYNKTGIQCVWSTIETIGRYAKEPKLYGLSNQPDCQKFGSPETVAYKLKKLSVKFEQSNNYDKSLIIKSVVKDRRGCLFSVPNHVMTLVHYDEKKGIVKYINNSDDQLQIRNWSIDEFNKRWDGWICVIYADQDIIPLKYIPIIDRNEPQNKFSEGYILQPETIIIK